MHQDNYRKALGLSVELPRANSNPKPQDRTAGSGPKLISRSRGKDRSSENFRKRWRTLVKTLRQLHGDYGAEFHLSMNRKFQDYVCQSRKDFLPLSADDVVCAYSSCFYSMLTV
ncbi:hypothetical protein F5X98DRAFT_79305 [Xylaria grammica]|nr:hypothetical protein F5X98DRAFT_79305 [Xylaria grammica]